MSIFSHAYVKVHGYKAIFKPKLQFKFFLLKALNVGTCKKSLFPEKNESNRLSKLKCIEFQGGLRMGMLA